MVGLRRAVAPEPDLGSDRGEQRTAPSVTSTPPWRSQPPHFGILPIHGAGPSLLIAPLFRTAGSRTSHSRTSWRSNTSGSFRSGPEDRSLILAAPTLPASSLLSTSAFYSGRAPDGIRGTSALGGMRLRLQLQAPSVPKASPFSTALKAAPPRAAPSHRCRALRLSGECRCRLPLRATPAPEASPFSTP